MTRPVPFVHPIGIRYLEVDRQGVVFNMWYLAYLDDAMTAFLAAGGLPYPEMLAVGYDAQVVHTEVDWHGPLGFGDPAAVHVRVSHIGRTSFTLGFEVVSSDACRGRRHHRVRGRPHRRIGEVRAAAGAARRARARDRDHRVDVAGPVVQEPAPGSGSTSCRRARVRGPSQPASRRRSSGDRLSRNAHATSSAASSELTATDSTPVEAAGQHRA